MLRNGGQSQDVSHGCRPSPRNFPAVHGPAHVPADRDRDRCAERSGGGDLAKIGAVAKRDVDSDRKAGSLRDGWGCEILAGDFLEGVPAGAHAYLLKHILHDWDDALNGARCRVASALTQT
jgi:hypothetical protein